MRESKKKGMFGVNREGVGRHLPTTTNSQQRNSIDFKLKKTLAQLKTSPGLLELLPPIAASQ
jgi:hypothetical protein